MARPRSSREKANLGFLVVEAFATVVQLASFWVDSVPWIDRYHDVVRQFLSNSFYNETALDLSLEYVKLQEQLEFDFIRSFAWNDTTRVLVTIVFISHVMTVIVLVVLLQRNAGSRFFLAALLMFSQILDLVIDCTTWASITNRIQAQTDFSWWDYPLLIITVASLMSSLNLVKTSPYSCWKLKLWFRHCTPVKTKLVLCIDCGFVIVVLAVLTTINIEVAYQPGQWFFDPQNGVPISVVSFATLLVLVIWLGAVTLSRLSECLQSSGIIRLILSVRCGVLGIFWGCTQAWVNALYIVPKRWSEGGSFEVLFAFGIVIFALLLLSWMLPWSAAVGDRNNCHEENGTASLPASVEQGCGETPNADSRGSTTNVSQQMQLA